MQKRHITNITNSEYDLIFIYRVLQERSRNLDNALFDLQVNTEGQIVISTDDENLFTEMDRFETLKEAADAMEDYVFEAEYDDDDHIPKIRKMRLTDELEA